MSTRKCASFCLMKQSPHNALPLFPNAVSTGMYLGALHDQTKHACDDNRSWTSVPLHCAIRNANTLIVTPYLSRQISLCQKALPASITALMMEAVSASGRSIPTSSSSSSCSGGSSIGSSSSSSGGCDDSSSSSSSSCSVTKNNSS
jgi:uncharacterized membrane protein YgcG